MEQGQRVKHRAIPVLTPEQIEQNRIAFMTGGERVEPRSLYAQDYSVSAEAVEYRRRLAGIEQPGCIRVERSTGDGASATSRLSTADTPFGSSAGDHYGWSIAAEGGAV